MIHQNRPIRVVVADDQDVVHNGIKSVCIENGIEAVAFAKTAKCLLDVLPTLENLPDVILLDLNMPEWIGSEQSHSVRMTTRQIKRIIPNVAIVVISTHKDLTLVNSVFSDQVVRGYWLKEDGLGSEDFLMLIDRAIKGHITVSKTIERLYREQEMQISPQISQRQTEILECIARYPDLNAREMAEKLDMCEQTLRNQMVKTSKRLDTKGKTAMFIEAVNRNIISFPYRINNC